MMSATDRVLETLHKRLEEEVYRNVKVFGCDVLDTTMDIGLRRQKQNKCAASRTMFDSQCLRCMITLVRNPSTSTLGVTKTRGQKRGKR